MGNIASFHKQKVLVSAFMHNSRLLSPDYLITAPNIQELMFTDKSINQILDEIKTDYETNSKHKQKWQKTFSPIEEAVVNTKDITTIQDLERLKSVLEARYGVNVLSLSLHNDEGYFSVLDTLGNEYSINRKDNSKFVNLEDNTLVKYQIEIDGEKKEIEGTLKRNFNHHAHIVYNRYDFENHKHILFSKEDLRDMQSITADCLNMERGMRGSKTKRLSHNQIAEQKHLENSVPKFFEINGEKLKMGDVKNFFKKNREVMINLKTYNQDDYMFMKKSESEILEKVKDKTITNSQELNSYIKKNTQLTYELQKLKFAQTELEEKSQKYFDGGKFLKERNGELKKEVEELKQKIKEVVEVNKDLLQERKSLKQQISTLQDKKLDDDMFNTFVKPKQQEEEHTYERDR